MSDYSSTSMHFLRVYQREILAEISALYVESQDETTTTIRKRDICDQINKLQAKLTPILAEIDRKMKLTFARENKKKQQYAAQQANESLRLQLRRHQQASIDAFDVWWENNKYKMHEDKRMSLYELMHCAWMSGETRIIKQGVLPVSNIMHVCNNWRLASERPSKSGEYLVRFDNDVYSIENYSNFDGWKEYSVPMTHWTEVPRI